MERLKNLRRQGVVGVIPCDPPICYALASFAERDSEMDLSPDQADAARSLVDGVNLTVVGEPDLVPAAPQMSSPPPKSPDKPKAKSSAPDTVEAPKTPPADPGATPLEG